LKILSGRKFHFVYCVVQIIFYHCIPIIFLAKFLFFWIFFFLKFFSKLGCIPWDIFVVEICIFQILDFYDEHRQDKSLVWLYMYRLWRHLLTSSWRHFYNLYQVLFYCSPFYIWIISLWTERWFKSDLTIDYCNNNSVTSRCVTSRDIKVQKDTFSLFLS